MQAVDDILEFIRREFTTEKESGFLRLKKVPDTNVKRFLDYFSTLVPQAQQALEEALPERALQIFFFPPDGENRTLRPDWNANAPFQQFAQAMVWTAGPKYWGVRELKRWASPNLHKIRGMSIDVPEEIIRLGPTLHPVKAPELRKRIKSAFMQMFSAKPRNEGGGNWLYEGRLHDSVVTVRIDYGGRSHQLRYEVMVQAHAPAVVLKRLTFESFLGAGFGWWNYITEENLDSSIALLGEFVTYLANLPSRLPVSYLRHVVSAGTTERGRPINEQ